jgi:hypothetical protein
MACRCFVFELFVLSKKGRHEVSAVKKWLVGFCRFELLPESKYMILL